MDTFTALAGKALWLILLLSLPPLLASLIVGLTISLFQALTQVQEQTLTFVPKIVATLIVLIIFAGWMLRHLIEFTKEVFGYIPKISGSG